jgi:two-component system OmpR family response regulator
MICKASGGPGHRRGAGGMSTLFVRPRTGLRPRTVGEVWYFRGMNAILPITNPSTRILIVDDDEGIRGLVSSFLEKHGFQVDTAGDPMEMRSKLKQGKYALIVLDVMMPGEDGLTALRTLQKSDGPPVIMLSAVGTDIDRIVGLEVGAEDYLAKPCNPRELLARIRTVLRRTSASGAPAAPPAPSAPEATLGEGVALHFAGWRLDLLARQLHDPSNIEVSLSDGEFRLLRAFLQHPRRVLTRNQLLDYVLGSGSEAYDRVIDVQISRLRRKLAFGQDRAELIRTVRSEGYMFMPSVSRG